MSNKKKSEKLKTFFKPVRYIFDTKTTMRSQRIMESMLLTYPELQECG